MFQLLQKLHRKVQHRVERIQRNVKIIRNVELLYRDPTIKSSKLLSKALEFILNNEQSALEYVMVELKKEPVKVTHILAEDVNGCLGSNTGNVGKLDWNAPDDMKHFVESTKGKVCIVGGTTFRSFGNRVLKNRQIVVVSKDKQTVERCTALPNHYVVANVIDAYNLACKLVYGNLDIPKDIMIIGGASIYRQTLHLVTNVLLSKINVDVKGNIQRDWDYPKNVILETLTFEGSKVV